MKRVFGYVKSYRVQAILAPLFKMTEAMFELLVPLVVARMIDIGIKNADKGYTMKMGLILVLLAVFGVSVSILAQYFSAVAAMGTGRLLRLDLFRHIQSLSYKELDDVGTSTLVTRMNSDVNQVQTGVNMFLRLFLRSPFVVFGALIMAFYVDRGMGRTFLIVLPVLTLVVCAVTYGSIPMYKNVQKKLDNVTLLTRESLVGVRVVRAFSREEQQIKEFKAAAENLKDYQSKVGGLSMLMNPVTYVIVNLGIVALIKAGALRVDEGTLTQGQIIALVNYMSQILVELVKLANLVVTLTKAVACAKRVNDIFEMKASIEYPSKSASGMTKSTSEVSKSDGQGAVPRVEFVNVSKSYHEGSDHSLTDVSFKVMPGETVGIIGGTGSGKTTLVNLIPRLYEASSGSIYIDGVDIKEYTMADIRNKVGLVPQKAVLFKGRVSDNVRWGKMDATDEEVREALTTAQAIGFIEEKEDGINYMLNQGARNLSGGQKQRVTIARALVRKPEILILDDSSSALDFATDAALRKAIRENTKGSTVFVVSQRASTIMHSDKIIVLDDGAVAGIGTHEDLLKSCDVYKEICDSQMSGEEAAV